MSETIETVKVADERAPGGCYLINKSDFDPAIHKAYEPPQPDGDSKPEGEGAPKPEAKPKTKVEK